MSRVRIHYDSRVLLHEIAPHHPESPERVAAVVQRLESDPEFSFGSPAPAERPQLLLAHDATYVARIFEIGSAGGGTLDPDTAMNAHSLTAALIAAGGAISAVRDALDGTPSFSAARPPGHHACRSRAMGFCFFNSAAIAARVARAEGVERVLIIDWDVHHGNGTQDIVWNDPDIRYVSLHQWPHYPGTGAEDETGCGNVFNVPRPPGLAPEVYVDDLDAAVKRAVDGWVPGLIVISAGFDAMRGDPLGGFTLEPEHYAELTRRWLSFGVPVASLLEGGYTPSRIADGVAAHVDALKTGW